MRDPDHRQIIPCSDIVRGCWELKQGRQERNFTVPIGLAGVDVQNNNRNLMISIFWVVSAVAGATLYSVQPSQAQTFTVIHNFTGGNDGKGPVAGLTAAGPGAFYGTAREGGNMGSNCLSNGCGLVFKMAYRGAGWVLTPIYTFQGGTDGANPSARVIIGANGLFGTTENGGGDACNGFAAGCGTIFELAPPPHVPANALGSWAENQLYRFAGGYDGADPYGDLTFDQTGNVYGTTQVGGSSNNCLPVGGGCGTAYKLSSSGSSWTKTILWSFGDGYDGVEPLNGLQFDTTGNLYGTTFTGGLYREGTVFELTPSGLGWTETVLYSFMGGSDGGLPYTGIILNQSGNLFAAASDSGSGGGGTLFELTKSGSSWSFNLLYSLGNPAGAECGPFGSLAMDAGGNLYGTTRCDGANQLGSVFELSPSGGGWTYRTLHDFSGGDGAYPYSTLVFDGSGNLYGTTYGGGVHGDGVVFEITR
jgi:uncharacterized repeat protein (TIGR03803 family)